MLSTRSSLVKTVPADYSSADGVDLVSSDNDLKNGIWPRSVTLWMAIIYLALFVIRPWELLFPWLSAIRIEKVYAICMVTMVLLRHHDRFRLGFQTLTVFLFFSAMVVSGIFALNPPLAWVQIYKYFTLVVFYIVMVMVIRTPYELVFLTAGYIATMTLYLGKSQWEFFLHGAGQYRMGVHRLTGIDGSFGGPNSLAGSIVLSLPLATFLWDSRKDFTSQWPSFWRKYYPLFLIGYFALALTSLILTNSRSGMVSFILFAILIALRGKNIRKRIGLLFLTACLLSMIWMMMPNESQNRFETIWNPKAGPLNAQQSSRGRIEGLLAGIEMFKEFPMTGVGPGNFIRYRWTEVDHVWLNAHSLIGQVLGETGLIGASTFLIMVLYALGACRKARSLSRDFATPTLQMLSSFALSCRDIIILLFFLGLFGHNLLRFNWLWMVAFGSHALYFAKETHMVLDSDPLSSHQTRS